jgi:hypothetical protein
MLIQSLASAKANNHLLAKLCENLLFTFGWFTLVLTCP